MSLRKSLDPEDLWRELKNCYNSLWARCIAIQDQEAWKNVAVIVSLSRKEENSAESEVKQRYESLRSLGVADIEDLILLFDTWPAEHFSSLLQELRNGELRIGNQNVRLRGGFDDFSIKQKSTYAERKGEYREFPIVSINQGAQKTPHQIGNFKKVENKLEPLGMKNFDEIGRQWLGMEPTTLGLNSTILFPLYFNLINMGIEDRNLDFNLKIHKGLIDNLGALICLRSRIDGKMTTIENERINNMPRQSSDGDFLFSEINYEFETYPREEDELLFRLTSNLGILLEEKTEVSNLLPKLPENPFLGLTTRFIEIDELEKGLREGKMKGKPNFNVSRAFERAVSWLLSIVGMKVVEVGDTRYGVLRREDKFEKGEADILAHDRNSEKTYVVDCTVKPPASDKVDKLGNLASSLRERGITSIEPMFFVMEDARESRTNVRNITVIEGNTIAKILEKLREDDVEEARRLSLNLSQK